MGSAPVHSFCRCRSRSSADHPLLLPFSAPSHAAVRITAVVYWRDLSLVAVEPHPSAERQFFLLRIYRRSFRFTRRYFLNIAPFLSLVSLRLGNFTVVQRTMHQRSCLPVSNISFICALSRNSACTRSPLIPCTCSFLFRLRLHSSTVPEVILQWIFSLPGRAVPPPIPAAK